MVRHKASKVQEADAMLTGYKDRVNQLHTLLLETAAFMSEPDCHAQRYDVSPSSGGAHPDPVARRFATIEALEAAVGRALDYVAPAIQVYQSLKNSHKEFERRMFLLFERHYIDGESFSDIAALLGCSERTIYRLDTKLVLMVCGRIRAWEKKKCQKKGGVML